MASVFDVAQYILDKLGPVTTWKLHKLCYYSQAWSLVWDDTPLFNDRIEAWVNGPVIPALYELHRGQYTISSIPTAQSDNLSTDQTETIDVVLECYGPQAATTLSELTHNETPWQNARKGLNPNDRGNVEITLDDMAEYYGRIYEQFEKSKTT
jgi:uncharacterized phage-associated protein